MTSNYLKSLKNIAELAPLRLTLALAGLRLDVALHGPAAPYLEADLRALAAGFVVSGKGKADLTCRVYYDHGRIYGRRFPGQPLLVRPADSPLAADIARRLAGLGVPLPAPPEAMTGFLNGCLLRDEGCGEGLIYLFYSRRAIHFPATLWKLLFVFASLAMVPRGRLMVHGAGVKRGRRGYLFLGASGAGKSTVCALSGDGVVFSDDATIVEVRDGCCRIHPTPFRQVGTASHRRQARLAEILFLHRDGGLRLQRRPERLAFAELLGVHLHAFAVMDGTLRKEAFHLCRRACAVTRAHDLFFTKDPRFWALLR